MLYRHLPAQTPFGIRFRREFWSITRRFAPVTAGCARAAFDAGVTSQAARNILMSSPLALQGFSPTGMEAKMRTPLPSSSTEGTKPSPISEGFRAFSVMTAHLMGRPATFGLALAVVLVWALTGPLFRFSDTWQLVINTGTSVVTFLMVFLIQSTQDRDTAAIQLKLDELILSVRQANNAAIAAEEMSDVAIDELKRKIRNQAESER
jgi:low affinity Fe/Cu permease